jgi:molybdopterin-biosynthesis enzyme MoeA-like protein
VLTAAADEALYHHTQELKSHRGVCAHRLRELEKRNQKMAAMLQKTKALLQIPLL